MIRIIERGTRAVATCENCGCKFSYEEEKRAMRND